MFYVFYAFIVNACLGNIIATFHTLVFCFHADDMLVLFSVCIETLENYIFHWWWIFNYFWCQRYFCTTGDIDAHPTSCIDLFALHGMLVCNVE